MKMNFAFRNFESFARGLKNTPVRDIKRNLKASLTQRISKYGFVSRAEFDIQTHVLLRTRAKLEALERRLAQFEDGNPQHSKEN